jgi:hypothetical protein
MKTARAGSAADNIDQVVVLYDARCTSLYLHARQLPHFVRNSRVFLRAFAESASTTQQTFIVQVAQYRFAIRRYASPQVNEPIKKVVRDCV